MSVSDSESDVIVMMFSIAIISLFRSCLKFRLQCRSAVFILMIAVMSRYFNMSSLISIGSLFQLFCVWFMFSLFVCW